MPSLETETESHPPGMAICRPASEGAALIALIYMLSASSCVKSFDCAKSSISGDELELLFESLRVSIVACLAASKLSVEMELMVDGFGCDLDVSLN